MKSQGGVSVVRRLENRLNKAFLTEAGKRKILVKVDYGHGYCNEGEYDNKKEALYALVCFMEDYLPEQFLGGRIKRYRL